MESSNKKTNRIPYRLYFSLFLFLILFTQACAGADRADFEAATDTKTKTDELTVSETAPACPEKALRERGTFLYSSEVEIHKDKLVTVELTIDFSPDSVNLLSGFAVFEDGILLQKLEYGQEDISVYTPGDSFISAEDINFDGNNDIYFEYGFSNGGASHIFFIWLPEENRFKECEELRGQKQPVLNEEKKEVEFCGGLGKNDCYYSYYRFNGSEATEYKSIIKEYDYEKEELHYEIYELLNGELQLTETYINPDFDPTEP